MIEILREVGRRAAVAAVAVPVVGTLLWLGGVYSAVLLATAAVIGTYEYYRLTPVPRSALTWLGAVGIAVIVASPIVFGSKWPQIAIVALAVTSTVAWTVVLATGPRVEAPARVGHVLAGLVFVGSGLTALAMLRARPDGLAWSTLVLATAWSNDTAAFLGGKLLGRHRLLPAVSPGKTWEGLATGALGGIVGALVTRACFRVISLRDAILVGTIAAVVGPIGDLNKSMLKRAAGAKDSGTLFGAHGGMLDRIDALLYDAIAVASYVALTRA